MQNHKNPIRQVLLLVFSLLFGTSLTKTAGYTVDAEFRPVKSLSLTLNDCFLATNYDIPLEGKVPLILIHGISLETGTAWESVEGKDHHSAWTNFIEYFNNSPELNTKYKLYIFGYKSNQVSVATIAKILSGYLNSLDSDSTSGIYSFPEFAFPRKEFVIVAHSMGGLVARTFMEETRSSTGAKWGESVSRLITLATPHHGTPAANKCELNILGGYDGGLGKLLTKGGILDPVGYQFAKRASELSFGAGILKNVPSYKTVNRVDLLWDNYDGLFQSGLAPEENSPLTAQLSSAAYDRKIIAYGGSIADGTIIHIGHDFALSATADLLANGLDIASDGIVPIESAWFQGRLENSQLRFRDDYDHYQMMEGKSAADPLFDMIEADLLAALPVVTSPQPTAPVSPASFQASRISFSQINLTWSAVSGVNGYKIERAYSGGSFTEITKVGIVTSFSDKGLSASSTYQYRVRAYNGGGNSGYSKVASATTSAPPIDGNNYTLSVQALDIESQTFAPLSITSWIGASSNYQTNTTTFARTVAKSSSVGLLCPNSLPNGKVFAYWMLDNNIPSYSTSASVTMNDNHTFIAVYASTANSPSSTRTFQSASVTGPSSVDENDTATYKLRYTYSDGSQEYHSAKWVVDPDDNSSISSSGVLDTDSVDSDQWVEVRANFTVDGKSKSTTKVVTIKNTKNTATYTLSLSGTNGHIIADPKASSYPAGTKVRLVADADYHYIFTGWNGAGLSGTNDTVYLTMDGNKSVTAFFAADPSVGSLQVNITPAQAAAEGAQWQFQNYTAFQDSGYTLKSVPPQKGYVNFKDIPGWITPDQIPTTVAGGQTTQVTGVYQEILCTVQVSMSPSEANAAGGRWRIDGGAWQESGTTLSSVSPGNHTLDFLPISGWATPASQSITSQRGASTSNIGTYGPPIGLPIITSVSPATGPLEGGTSVTIQGINFQAGASVTFGGVAAKSVQLISPSQIVAVTPARSSYGTVAVALTSNGQTATSTNGFSYLIPLGQNVQLVGQIGGNVGAVAVAGNMVYYGEGTTLVTMDFTNSAAPTEKGRVTLPGLINGIALSGNTAFVTAGSAGLYALDISSPASPAIIGLFNTGGYAAGLAVANSTAYVADSQTKKLEILNVTTPSAITRLGSISTDGRPSRVAVGTISSKTYAFVAENDLAVRVVDVSSPAAPVVVSSIPAQSSGGFADVKVVGTTLYASDKNQIGLRIIDVSAPGNPISSGVFDTGITGFIDVVGNRLFVCDSGLFIGDLNSKPNATRLGYYNASSNCNGIVVSNGLAFIAGGSAGLQVISVSNPAAPALRSVVPSILSSTEDVAIAGNTLFVGGDDGLHAVDVTNPARPFQIGKLLGARASNLAVAEGKATLVNYGNKTVRVVDVSNPSSLALLGTYTAVEAWSIGLLGSIPVIAAATNDTAHYPLIDILNLTSPASPTRESSLVLNNANGVAGAISVIGNWAFVGSPNRAIDIVNLSDPNTPVKAGSVAISGFFSDITASKDANFVYVPVSGGIQVVNVTQKTAPVLAQIVTSPAAPYPNMYSVCASGDMLYADSGGFISIFDISNPSTPQFVGYYDTPGSGNGLTVANDLIYVADYNAGVSILRVLNLSKPTITITSPSPAAPLQTTTGTISISGTATDKKVITSITWQNDRGGGGTATGTTTWAINGVVLSSGTNVITISAQDVDGNSASTTLTVNAIFPDTTAPAVEITGPKTDDQFTVNAPAVNLTGSAADNRGVTSITWSNERGGSGTAAMANGSWSVPDLALEEGPNPITVTATDAANNQATASAVIFYTPPDVDAPMVTINFPTEAPTYETKAATINLSGESSDNQLVSKITLTNSTGGSGEVTGTSPWSVNDVALQPGLNVIDVTATDGSGNTQTDTLSVTYTVPIQGTLTLSGTAFSVDEGAGMLSIPVTRNGGSDGEVALAYTLTAGTAGNGDFTGTGGTLTFEDGETSQNIVIPIVDDLVIEGPETFTLSLSNPTGGAALGTMTTATVTINDNDDTDGDGILDSWEREHFEGDLTTAGVGTDADEDGYSDLVESQRGTDPKVPDHEQFQPDAAIGPVGQPKKMIGKDKYDASGSSEQMEAALKPKTARTAVIMIQNDGSEKDTILVKGPEADEHFTVHYRLGKKDVTKKVLAGTLALSLKPGEAEKLKATVAVKKAAESGEEFPIKVELSSQGDPNAYHDAVIFNVTVK